MHRLPSPFAVRRFRIASTFLVLKWSLMATAAVLLVYSMTTNTRESAMLAMILMGSAVPVTLLQWVTAARARCPLCLGNPLSHRSCSKNAKAHKLFGSYRLFVAVSVIFTGKFRCPYCGEHTAVVSRCDRPQCETIR
jgi:cytochrome bd-type quinol oxidase subunit 1